MYISVCMRGPEEGELWVAKSSQQSFLFNFHNASSLQSGVARAESL